MASGYDLTNKHPYRLQQARIGVYEKKPFQEKSIEGINHMSTRLKVQGGHHQQERMIYQKKESFKRALFNSYQAAKIVNVQAEDCEPVRALINPNKLKPDYDDKILSVGYEYNFKPGDVFEWIGTNTHWLIYLQNLTELAYFRGDIRKCSYTIKWEDEEGNPQETWVALQGPVEIRINSIQKNGISLDVPNHSLEILMPKNDATIKRFKRYNKFYVTGTDEITSSICWRVEATDTLSMPGILQITAVEYYANIHEDDIEAGTVGTLIANVEVSDESKTLIYGETFIKPKKTYEYIYRGKEKGNWYIDCKYPIKYSIQDNKIVLSWDKTYSGQFELFYGNISKTIVVESLF